MRDPDLRHSAASAQATNPTIEIRRVLSEADRKPFIESVVAKKGLPERSITALFTGALGLRVRRSAYQQEAGLEYDAANRDLKSLVDAGLLSARGETPGRFYVGTPELREIYGLVRMANGDKIANPYAEGDDADPQDSLFWSPAPSLGFAAE